MGHNVLAAIQEFCRVLAAGPPPVDAADAGGHVYFDLWGRAMVGCEGRGARSGARSQGWWRRLVSAVSCASAALGRAPDAPPAAHSARRLPLRQVIYSHAQAKALHHAPLAIVLLLPLLASADDAQQLTFAGLARATGLALASMLCALVLPVAVGAGRAMLSGRRGLAGDATGAWRTAALATSTRLAPAPQHCLPRNPVAHLHPRTSSAPSLATAHPGFPMPWYGRPAVAYATFLPAAAAGVLLPHVLAPAAAPGGGARGTSAAGRACGTALLFALVCSGLTSVGMHSSFFYALWAAAAALAAALLGTGAAGGGTCGSWRGAAALLACFAPAAGVALPSAVTFMAHVMEKVGLAGAAPGLLGLVSADAAVGAVAGAAMLLTLGTLAPHVAGALGARRGRALAAALLAASLGAAAWSSAAFGQPYSREHPKRLLVQHVHRQAPGERRAGGEGRGETGARPRAGWGRAASWPRAARRRLSARPRCLAPSHPHPRPPARKQAAGWQTPSCRWWAWTRLPCSRCCRPPGWRCRPPPPATRTGR